MLSYQQQLKGLIEDKRKEMIKAGLAKGLQSEEVVTISQELDLMMNLYQLITALLVSV